MTYEQYRKAFGLERKEWKREQITECDYSFEQLEDEELPYAWLHEMDREIGIEQTAWLDRSQEQRIAFVRWDVDPCGELIHSAVSLKPCTPDQIQQLMRSRAVLSGVYLLRINWMASDTEIVREFKKAISHQKPAASERAIHEKRGRQHDYRAWFTDLAIYRLRQQYNEAQIQTKFHHDATRQRVHQARKSIEKRIKLHVMGDAEGRGIQLSGGMSDK